MLQTEDIDDDYFTPASSTSLANIFGKSGHDTTDNESLKYTPPKPNPRPTGKIEVQKATQCIFACTLVGYEWYNGAYINRGKLGFAILNMVKTGAHNLILYDSKKVTLSSATISTNLKVTVKEISYFSYLDNLQKYWSLYATANEVNKIVDLLKGYNVEIKYTSEEEKKPDEMSPQDPVALNKDSTDNVQKESDTDSSLNRKTKMSIINRMANMGQSVLPHKVMPVEKCSDSSDTDDDHYKTIRHKLTKSTKKNTSDKSFAECQTLVEAQKILPRKDHSTESMPLFTYVNGQLVPVTNTNIITSSTVSSSSTDMTYFISEQRMNNSELRVNMNRISDKVDQVLKKLTNIDKRDKKSAGDFQLELLQKLLAEYENKIKVYEEYIRKSDDNINITNLFVNPKLQGTDQDSQINVLKDKIHKFEQLCIEKDAKINSLESEMQCLKAKHDEDAVNERLNINKLSQNIQNLESKLETKNKEYSSLMNKYEKNVNDHLKPDDDNDVGNKIKKVMNDTYRAISANFENDESYSGERVKSVTATVIKRVTIDSLSSI